MASSAFQAGVDSIAVATLTTNGDLLTRTAGVPARLTRADLAVDPVFANLPRFKQTIYTGTTNFTSPSAFADIDATAFPALSLTLAVGDVVDLSLQAAYSNNSAGTVCGWDWLIDRPTSADTTIRANGTKAAAWFHQFPTNGTDADTIEAKGTFVCTEAGVHTFKPQWRFFFSGTTTMLNTGANYLLAATHKVTNTGPVTA